MARWGPLGDVLREKASPDTLSRVDRLTRWAADLLTRVPGTFPAYTLHDARHAENVVMLMGRLLGPRVGQVRVLEATLLILAAYFHDTGMVYSADDLAAATREPEFREFLDTDDDALLETHANGGVPTDSVIERYCRHRHADRVRVHLERVDPGLLEFDGIPVIDQLDLLCRSHNQPAAALLDPAFKTDFAFQADLRLCAVLLRLADIMDLDNSRTPAVIYDHLGLTDRASADRAVSDDEWRKHLAARGFQFPQQPVANYTVQFMATPDEPGVEHDLRRFLSVIEDELQMCRTVRDACGDQWRDLPLPGHIDAGQITSNGYKYGEFRFELDRSSVLDLFAGEQLYGTPYAFLRELLQNALDAVRLRTHLHGAGSGSDEPPRVEVTCWEDAGGYIWVRIDDDGIGMDEEAIRNYFLKVGRLSSTRQSNTVMIRCCSERRKTWRRWVGRGCPRCRNVSCGSGGSPGSRSARSAVRWANTRGRSMASSRPTVASCRRRAGAGRVR